MKLKIWIDEGREGNKFRRTLWDIKQILRYIYLKTPYRQRASKIIHSHKAIYFDIPKVATSSIFSLIYKEVYNKEKDNYYDMYRFFPQVREIDTDKKWFKEYYKFTFVRNPYSKIVSCYKDLIVKHKIKSIIDCLGISEDASFKEFVSAVSKKTDKELGDMDTHIRPQHLYLYKNNKLLVDYIGRVESIKEDINIIFKKIGFNKVDEIPTLNRSAIDDYKKYYNDETRDIVFKRYKKDFELFNYNGDVI